MIETTINGARVSTVRGRYGVFQTTVTGGALDGVADTCSDEEEAEQMHALMCAHVRADANILVIA